MYSTKISGSRLKHEKDYRKKKHTKLISKSINDYMSIFIFRTI